MVGLEDSITAIEQITVILNLDDLKYSIIGVFIFYAAINHYIFKLQRPLVNPDKIMWSKTESGLIFPD
jgi:hypothetical protein